MLTKHQLHQQQWKTKMTDKDKIKTNYHNNYRKSNKTTKVSNNTHPLDKRHDKLVKRHYSQEAGYKVVSY